MSAEKTSANTASHRAESHSARGPAKRRSQKSRRSEGCGFVLIAAAVACGLLLINSVFASVLLGIFEVVGIRDVDPKLAQGFLFIVPLLLLILQWWLYDLFRG